MTTEMHDLFPHEYPITLQEIADPPEKLYVRGQLPSPETKVLAVIGSRALSRYGREACETLIEGLAGYPISIVSGLALGADACAHRAALDAGLHTIAVLGSGLHDDVIGPRTNFGLAQEILKKGGALVSENEPDYEAHAYDFPARNRIMVGLADAVLMVEAGPQSGSLISAKYAGEYNRELLCIPHRIGDPHGYGAEVFLRIGATLVTKPEHILEALQIPLAEPEVVFDRVRATLNQTELTLFDLLQTPRSRDELIRMNQTMPSHELLTALMSLELKGLAQEKFGLWRHS